MARIRNQQLAVTVVVGTATLLVCLFPEDLATAKPRRKGCLAGMSMVSGQYCIDRYEASVVEIGAKGRTKRHPHYMPVKGLKVKAVSRKGVYPQGYISQKEAAAACKAAKKRLCTDDEWVKACKGKKPTTFPYGEDRVPERCNDTKRVSPLMHYFGNPTSGVYPYSYDSMNDPRLNQLKGGLLPTGSKPKCRSSYQTFDMVGNLHEWTADPKGTFRGGYYLDTKINGDGCKYRTTAHNADYHDYSTGFRCCADPR
jgi:formylglycine-generating enzyme